MTTLTTDPGALPGPVHGPLSRAPSGAPSGRLSGPRPGSLSATTVLDVVVPVFNEQHSLGSCVRRLHDHLTSSVPYSFRITIADNASTDATLDVAHDLASVLPCVRVVYLDEKGRGRALASVWRASDADVLAYMDVDLSTDLSALLPLVAPLVSGHSDVAIGTRLARTSRVVRGAKREVISRCYNLILRGTLAARFSDAQCGFKALRRDVARELLPLVEDTGWFFDTELLVLAERSGLRIHEVPVDWVDDPDSRVDVVATAVDDLKGVARLGRALATGRLPLSQVRASLGRGALVGPGEGAVGVGSGAAGSGAAGSGAGGSSAARLGAAGSGAGGSSAARLGAAGSGAAGVPAAMLGQAVRFAGVGVISTLAYLLLYLLARPALGAQWANATALLLTAVANTAANRRFTFGVSGADGAGRHQLQGLVVFALGLALTSGSLAALHALSAAPPRLVEVAVLVAANAAATVLRFVLLRVWVFNRR